MEPLIANWVDTVSMPYTEDGIVTYEFAGVLSQYRDDINWALDRVSEVTSLEFVKVSSDAEWRFGDLTKDSQYAGYGGRAWGFPGGLGWDIIFTDHRVTTANYERYIVLHEIGHALGLEHPFDTSDGDEWKGATVEDTVMAYYPSTTVNDYTAADWDAITGLYGGKAPKVEVEVVETPVEEVEVVEVDDDVVETPVEEVVETPVEEVEEVETPVEVDDDVVESEKERIGDRRWNKFVRKMENGNTEKVVGWLDKQGFIVNADLNQRLRRNTFTLDEEADIMSHVLNKDWQAIGQTKYFTLHDSNAALCPCCS